MKKINAKIYADEDFSGKFFIKHDNGRVEVANVVTPKRTAQRGGYAFFFRTPDAQKRAVLGGKRASTAENPASTGETSRVIHRNPWPTIHPSPTLCKCLNAACARN